MGKDSSGAWLNTSRQAWNWATITYGAGTDSITWSWNWGTDSLIMGENFLVAVPLESDAGTTNNHGLGTPFAGNLAVYPIYRMAGPMTGAAEQESGLGPIALACRPNPLRRQATITYSLPRAGPTSLKLYDVAGKLVSTLVSGLARAGSHHYVLLPARNSLSRGVYFIRLETEGETLTRKLIIE